MRYRGRARRAIHHWTDSWCCQPAAVSPALPPVACAGCIVVDISNRTVCPALELGNGALLAASGLVLQLWQYRELATRAYRSRPPPPVGKYCEHPGLSLSARLQPGTAPADQVACLCLERVRGAVIPLSLHWRTYTSIQSSKLP